MELHELEQAHQYFNESVGAHRDMSLEVVSLNDGKVELMMPYQNRHASHKINGGLHTGALAAAIDSACGFVVMLSLDEPQAIATINLRLDHIRQAPPGEDVRIYAECYQVHNDVAYVNAHANNSVGNSLLCSAVGLFKLGSPGPALFANMETSEN